jgi:hypothetical protein
MWTVRSTWPGRLTVMRRTQPGGSGVPDVSAPTRADLELVIVSGSAVGRSIRLRRGHSTIGAGRRCDIVLAVPGVLPRHAEAHYGDDGVLQVRGLRPGSTFVNDAAADAWTHLRPGDFLRLRNVELVIRESGDAEGPSGTLQSPTSVRRRPTLPSRADLDETLARTEARRPASPTESVPGAAFLQPDTLIADRYRIVDRVAAGGMGEVYRAEHVELGRVFALKVMRPDLSSDPEFVKRFKREAVASGRIGHKNIVDITDFGRTTDGRFYYVMELLEGETLASVIEREGAQPIPRVMHFALQMARALGATHRLGIVHRDLKPENVMVLQRDGELDLVKVVDFGIAKVASGQGAGGQTVIGTVVGTPQYMAPEQAAGLEVDARSDLYSLGLIFYELVTGRPAFSGKTPSILMSLQMTASPAPMIARPGTPPPPMLGKLIFRMLEKNPADRPQSSDEVVEVLEALRRRRRQAVLRRARQRR